MFTLFSALVVNPMLCLDKTKAYDISLQKTLQIMFLHQDLSLHAIFIKSDICTLAEGGGLEPAITCLAVLDPKGSVSLWKQQLRA